MSAETKHTKEPWTWSGRKIPHFLGGEHTELEIHTAYDDGQLHAPYPIVSLSVGIGLNRGDVIHMVNMTEANARRIVACVNACAGISDEQLEDDKLDVFLQALRIRELEAQNKELRELADNVMVMANSVIKCYTDRPQNFACAIAHLKQDIETLNKALSGGG